MWLSKTGPGFNHKRNILELFAKTANSSLKEHIENSSLEDFVNNKERRENLDPQSLYNPLLPLILLGSPGIMMIPLHNLQKIKIFLPSSIDIFYIFTFSYLH
jgi:hypothetical protein